MERQKHHIMRKSYKPVKPLYTGVYVSEVGKKDEIFTLEMMAVKGCAE